MSSLKRLFTPALKEKEKKKDILALEVSEIEEIAEKLFKRIDKKIEELEKAERAARGSIEKFEKLIERLESLNIPSDIAADPGYREVKSLAQKGLKVDEIARILDVPKGEVELILNLLK